VDVAPVVVVPAAPAVRRVEDAWSMRMDASQFSTTPTTSKRRRFAAAAA
jgi:hypothetical protein